MREDAEWVADTITALRAEVEKWQETARASEKRVAYAQAENEKLRAALERFCRRVDDGEIRSRTTYAEFKALLAALPVAP